MEAVVLVVHLLIAVSLIGVVLVQKSEGGGLGIGGSGGGMMSARGSANLLTRATAVLAGVFMLTSLVLAIMAGGQSTPRSIIDSMPPAPQQSVPADAPPAAPAAPEAPVSK
ncbi:preprotein translocase subunit SecG [Skermanella stibiiresistens SB22]|uniref:Protein-export membrane protein SecG n=2 Tax=Skermanella TaxID=204447 RepID=W9H7S6_9PROT|nr:preprotein translocase subunit SecG [Skermanella stibiiresistens]EWY42285.1 preprotein translocase subunit SecG [Skermanella stibiiresistens SB22]